ncbi:DNA repair protein RecN [Leuconostoc gasicomitatum]|uniref:DNA repair protein RecN n=1 Tax=Leuconostoc gasicomitatum TaxID=115778 RepID=UPI000BD87EEB|nr:DNA repair protein RecN [Leuconostoc gasicomitatum]MBZ5944740.1 DNA repair protein RecN [Leuconostoc gasicomitatum]MBZ5945952.1 DNA repair protein RecN [Leuconostoc gasicomitatum]MBZ5949771.1 DNA repair protein RecN [Leuconostoc gasicomitatum]MBZ5951901.1 DNA repair protein RecN [Leuconostoc gasicomitatum]MBZ5968027.1 DNA repair protein RecN [Leuconostoc gasicomitatum]
MLENLIIENFAIIEKVALQFDSGMSVLTGETGAGKSIIIDALLMLTGGRANSEMIRHGSKKAILQAVFSVPKNKILIDKLIENGIDIDDGELIIYRELKHNGRSMIRINSVLVNLKTLSIIGRYLVDIQGQNDTQQLLNPEEHLPLLDAYGDEQLLVTKSAYQQIFHEFRAITQRIRRIQTSQQEITQRLDLLQFQQQELEDADLQPNEENDLLDARGKLLNYKKIADRLQNAQIALNGDQGGAVDLLAEAMQALQEIAEYDDNYAELARTIADSYYTAQEVSRDVDEQMSDLTYDEAELLRIDERLQLIHSLERKYGTTVADVLIFKDHVDKELSMVDNDELDVEKLQVTQNDLRQVLRKQAIKLREARQKVARGLEQAVNQQLNELLMVGAEFTVHFEQIEGFISSGTDKVEFHVQTNVGEGMSPLVKIASGGETARLMLAIKTAFTKQQHIISIVFDEADTGVSGRVAQAIAKKMLTIAADSQVLAITHLPQVAAAAAHHFLIAKTTEMDRTVTQVTALDEAGRERAIAMMLSGDNITKTALANARDLRKQALKLS